jgi:hypothetical protein
MQAWERRARDGPHLTDRWQLAGSACSFSFVSPSVFSIKNGIRPEPEGVEASTKSDSYLMVVGRGGKRGWVGGGGRGGVTKIGAVLEGSGTRIKGKVDVGCGRAHHRNIFDSSSLASRPFIRILPSPGES